MFNNKRSFFERITGSSSYDIEEEQNAEAKVVSPYGETKPARVATPIQAEDEGEEGELSVDVYNGQSEIVIQTMIAGVKPEDLSITVTREMITLKGRRERPNDMMDDGYSQKELYWGSFSRTIMLPAEVESEEAEAIERHGLLTVRLPKIDKERIQKIKVKSI